MMLNLARNKLPNLSAVVLFQRTVYLPLFNRNYSLTVQLNNKVTVNFPNGSLYYGDISHNKRHGFGTNTTADNVKYVGNWIDDLPDGFGEITMPDGSTYKGYCVAGQRSGHGKSTDTEGNRYDGNWYNNVKSGVGELTYLNGSVYVGEFARDKPNGKGKCTYPDGTFVEGNFKNGIPFR